MKGLKSLAEALLHQVFDEDSLLRIVGKGVLKGGISIAKNVGKAGI